MPSWAINVPSGLRGDSGVVGVVDEPADRRVVLSDSVDMPPSVMVGVRSTPPSLPPPADAPIGERFRSGSPSGISEVAGEGALLGTIVVVIFVCGRLLGGALNDSCDWYCFGWTCSGVTASCCLRFFAKLYF